MPRPYISPIVIDFLAIGHITEDLLSTGGRALGGTATYSAITARNLGCRTYLLTRAADNFSNPELLHDITIRRVPSAHTSVFENIYHDTQRTQFLRARAETLVPDDLPDEWRDPALVMLGSVCREIDARFARLFPHALIAIVPQGWMRQWDDTCRVQPRVWEEAAEILPHVNMLVLSEDDIAPFPEKLSEYIALAPLTVLTRAERGATVYERGQPPFDSPAFPAHLVDPTGAGDVFCAAFLIRYAETRDVKQAARFANCTASFCVEGIGTRGIPTRAQVEERLRSDE